MRLAELNDEVKQDCTPIIALFDIGPEIRSESMRLHKTRTSTSVESNHVSPRPLRREITFSSESDESYGLQLLSRIASDLQVKEGTNLIIPVAVVRHRHLDASRRGSAADTQLDGSTLAISENSTKEIDPQKMLRCLEAGAVDILPSPVDQVRVMGLTVHAYRVFKTAKKEQNSFLAQSRPRRQSWVGVDDPKPYGYLREAMELSIPEERKSVVAKEVGEWSFCGHDFTDDELVYAAFCMLNHALQMPELAKWRMPADDILSFVQAARMAYNSFVLYHNFRHAIDVLQSLFHFLVRIGVLPAYKTNGEKETQQTPRSPIASLLMPFDGLTLLISAIGHDVGHPGVNNMFLVKLNAPLAQLYNDQSVLEAFHCAAYSQILRRHWPAAFEDKALRKLLISSILATDMGVHYDYMQQLGNLQERIHESKVTDGWAPKDLETYKVLACGLLIKCADISNVARPWPVAEKWTFLLQDEFAHQGEMERQIGMETTLFGGPPEIGNILKLANGQIGFMTMFALPLFEAVADIMPSMNFAAEEISTNKSTWSAKVEQEKRRDYLRRETGMAEGLISPRTQSPAAPLKRDKPPLAVGSEESSGYFPSPLKNVSDATEKEDSKALANHDSGTVSPGGSHQSSLVSPAAVNSNITSSPERASQSSSSAYHGPDAHESSNIGLKSTSSHSQLYKSKDEIPGSASLARRHSSENLRSSLRGGKGDEATDLTGSLAADAFPRRQEAGRSSVPWVKSDKKIRGAKKTPKLSSMFTSSSITPQDSPEKSHGAGDRDNSTSDQQSTSECLPSVLSLGSHSDTSKSSIRVDVRNGNKTVPRRRSRLRLAFWRKRNGSDNDA
ncbi:MAG: hypothetical protein Q9227_005359 [Pyrenula ochraceoflavens]